jgi:soluble lytic murein transglycosylase-like protein
MNMVRMLSLVIGMMLAASASLARADIYSFVDDDGVTHFSNVPTDPRFQFLLASPADRTQSGQAYSPALLAKSVQFDPIIEKAALAASVEADLLRAVIVVESGFNARAVSKAGAVGLMQLMPATAKRFGATDRYDPTQNVHAGARYLKSLIDRYGKDIELALAAYNAGEDAVDRCGRCIPAFRETQAYVPKVLSVYDRLVAQTRTT